MDKSYKSYRYQIYHGQVPKKYVMIGMAIGAVLGMALLVIAVALAWAWIVPDVFAGAVARGSIPATLSLFQAMKIALPFGILASVSQILMGIGRKISNPNEQ